MAEDDRIIAVKDINRAILVIKFLN